MRKSTLIAIVERETYRGENSLTKEKEEESVELHILHLRSWNSIIAQTQCLENDVDVILLFEIKLKREKKKKANFVREYF